MQLLLDTHAFLWFAAGDAGLSATARNLIADLDNRAFVSSATLWEIALKTSLGKLTLPEPFDPYIGKLLVDLAIELLPISLSDLGTLVTLPFHHRDPFDRLLIAQALTRDLTLVSRDSAFADYGVQLAW